jgi:hypothetical protein
MTPPDLTDIEVGEICDPLTQPAAQVRYLRSLGLRVDRKPNGRPLVNRAHYDAVRGAATARPAAEPRWAV